MKMNSLPYIRCYAMLCNDETIANGTFGMLCILACERLLTIYAFAELQFT